MAPSPRLLLLAALAAACSGGWRRYDRGPHHRSPPGDAAARDRGHHPDLGRTAGDTFTPLFEQSGREGGWLGPAIIAPSPDGSRLAVVWLDDATRSAAGTYTSRLSLLDFAATDLPVDPRDLPELWSTEGTDDVVLRSSPAVTWSLGDRIALAVADGTYADGDPAAAPTVTVVLQLEG